MLFFTKNIQYLKNRKNTNIAEIVVKLGSTFPYLVSGEIQPTVQDMLAISEFFQVNIDDLLKKDLAKHARLFVEKDIRFLVLDVDGTLTDGGMYFTTSGEEMKKFNAKDGRGIIELAKIDFPVGLLSSGTNEPLLANRARILDIGRLYAGKENKLVILQKWCNELGITLDQVAYMGDDINDLTIFPHVGLTGCPSDAVAEIREIAHIVLSLKGGEGCVREFIDDFVMPHAQRRRAKAKATAVK